MDAVLGQDAIVTFLRSRIADPPHLILIGTTGVGKTMLANAWISEHLSHQGVPAAHHATMTLRLSSADDRGIAAIRQRLTEFVRRVRPVANALAWVLIDDADNLPAVTQQALRRILELHAHQTRFCFIAQTCENFIEPIQSRCVMLKAVPVDLEAHGPELLRLAGQAVTSDDLRLMAGLCNGNARQMTIVAAALQYSTDLSLLLNAPPVTQLLALQTAIVRRDISEITATVLGLWSKGYSFEDCIAMLETVVRLYNDTLTMDLQYVLQCCAEGHVYQILNRTTTLDLIAVLSGHASSESLGERL
jgi:replication factor C subunit 2/4